MKKNQIINGAVSLILLLVLCTSGYAQKVKELSREKVIDAMKKSSDYMVNKVSAHGGYLWYYSEDFSEREGEAPGRESQIVVQGGAQLKEIMSASLKGIEITLLWDKSNREHTTICTQPVDVRIEAD